MIDSHSHLYCDAFDDDRDLAMARALEAGVTHIVLPNENLESVQRVVAMHRAYPTATSIALGLHPEDVDEGYEQQLTALRPLLDEHHPVAVGEIGIDLYWDKTWREQQMAALHTQLHWCKELGIPFIMHCRDALDEILSVMDNFGEPLPQGVFHSFTGTPQEVEQVRQRGDFYFGVNGIVTFKKSNVKDILPVVGLDRLLLELRLGRMHEAARTPAWGGVAVRHEGLRQHAQPHGHLDKRQDRRPDKAGRAIGEHRRRLRGEVPVERKRRMPLPRHGRNRPRKRDGHSMTTRKDRR